MWYTESCGILGNRDLYGIQRHVVYWKKLAGSANCHFRDKIKVTFFTEEFLITYKTLVASLYFAFFSAVGITTLKKPSL